MTDRRNVIRRLAVREYAPMAGWLLAWVIIGVAVGHADAVRMLAASALVRSARYLTSPATGPSLRMRVDFSGRIPHRVRLTALLVEFAAVVASVTVAGLIALLLLHADEPETAAFCVVLAALLPARLLAPFMAAKDTAGFYQPLLAWTGVALVGLVWLFGGPALWFAAALAARDWVATILASALARPRAAATVTDEALHWREIADRSHANGRRTFTYRVSKSLLKFAFGPFGSIAARTGRGFRLDRKLERFIPRKTANLAAMWLLLSGAAVALILIIPKPVIQLLAASLLRVGASAGNIVIWSKLGRGEVFAAKGDDDDED